MEDILDSKNEFDIENLRQLRSVILKYNTLLEKFNDKNADIWNNIEILLKDWYKKKLTEHYLISYSNEIEKNLKISLKTRTLCKNTKSYLGALFIYIKGILMPLKTNPKMLKLLVESIENNDEISYEDNVFLAEEFVNLLFVDFNAEENFEKLFLNHIDALLAMTFNKVKDRSYNEIFKPVNFITQILEAFVKKEKVRNYTKRLFLKGLNCMAESLQLFDNIGVKALVIDREEVKENKAVLVKSEALLSKDTLGCKATYFSEVEPVSGSEFKDEDKMSSDKTIKIIEVTLESIEKQVEGMPLEIRFICKLIEKYTNIHYSKEDSFEITKNLILDFLFHKWWSVALIDWQKNFLVNLRIAEANFQRRIIHIQDLLKAILYYPKDTNITFTTSIREYIESKRNFTNTYINSLLNITCPSFESTGNTYLNINSACISYRALEIVIEALCKCIDKMKSIDASYEVFITRIKDSISSGQINSKCNFVGDPIDSLNTLIDDTLYEPYFLFQDISLKENAHEIMLSENWERILANLLLNIDISPHKDYSLLSEDNKFLSLLNELIKQPTSFAISSNCTVDIELLANYIIDFFKDKSKDYIFESINKLNNKYQDMIKTLCGDIRRTKSRIKVTTRMIEEECKNLRKFNESYIRNVIAKIIAHKIIMTFILSFKIKLKEINLKSKRPSVYHLIVYELDENSSSKVPSLNQGALSESNSGEKDVVEGKSIKDLANSFSKLKNASPPMKDFNIKDLVSIHETFISSLSKSLPKLVKELPNNLEDILGHIDDYVMHSIHDIIYLNVPSKEDISFLTRLKQLKAQGVISNLISSDAIPNELLELTIKKLQESSTLITAKDKFNMYKEMHKIIDWWIEIMEMQQDIVIVCDISQIVTLTIAYAELPHIITDVEYVDEFVQDESKEEYMVNIKFSINFLNTINVP